MYWVRCLFFTTPLFFLLSLTGYSDEYISEYPELSGGATGYNRAAAGGYVSEYPELAGEATGYNSVEATGYNSTEATGYNSEEAVEFKLRSTVDRSLSDEVANTGLSSIAAGVVGNVFGLSWTGLGTLLKSGGVSNAVFANVTASAIGWGVLLGMGSILARTYLKTPSDLLFRPLFWVVYKFMQVEDFIFYEEYPTALDQKHKAFLQPVSDRLTSVAERVFDIPASYWEIDLMSTGGPNAFSVGGYKIGIYRSIFTVAKNEAGMACILGHEMGHVLAKHSGQRMTDFLFFNEKALASIPFTNAIAHNQEHQADEIGLYLMALAGYDPSECSHVWERFTSAAGDVRGIIRIFLASHPTNASRMAALQKLGSQLKGYYARKPGALGLGMEYEL